MQSVVAGDAHFSAAAVSPSFPFHWTHSFSRPLHARSSFFSHEEQSCRSQRALPEREENKRRRKGSIGARLIHVLFAEGMGCDDALALARSTSSSSSTLPSADLLSLAHKQTTTSTNERKQHTPPQKKTLSTQARQAAVQAAQKAIGFSYLLGKSDRIVAVALPTALVAFSFLAIAKGAAQMYTQPGKNS